MSGKQDLILFTASFPYGKGETFLETEIRYLSLHFRSVFIIPQKIQFLEQRSIPSNCNIITDHVEKDGESNETPFNAYFAILPVLWSEILKEGLNKQKLIYKVSHLKSLYRRSTKIKKWIDSQSLTKPIYYSYWFDNSATILYFIGEKSKEFSFVSRAHGFDLFEERQANNRIPYRKYQFKYASWIYSVSKMGMNYLQKKYPNQCSKVSYSHLGSADFGYQDIMKIGEPYLIVSCGSLIELKRIHLIINLLKECSLKVHWVHFGDGPLRDKLIDACKFLPENITFDFKGFVANSMIVSFYKENFVDAFISMSETEGLPYSFMEAISFGIPIISTNVGGVGEIVNANTGLLIEEDFEIKLLAKQVSKFLATYSKNETLRTNIRLFWEKNFSAQKNYNSFIKMLVDENSR